MDTLNRNGIPAALLKLVFFLLVKGDLGEPSVDTNEFFSGKQEWSQAMRQEGFVAKTFELLDSAEQDMCSPQGFCIAVRNILNTKIAGLNCRCLLVLDMDEPRHIPKEPIESSGQHRPRIRSSSKLDDCTGDPFDAIGLGMRPSLRAGKSCILAHRISSKVPGIFGGLCHLQGQAEPWRFRRPYKEADHVVLHRGLAA